MKILPVKAELLHADRRADMTKTVVFRTFAIAPNKQLQANIRFCKTLHNAYLIHRKLYFPGEMESDKVSQNEGRTSVFVC